jgi:hypothetical protein
MKKAILFKLTFVLVAMIALGWLPQPVLAQRGGHGGGGGFHGGGGGGFHGGGGGGGFHGSGGFYAEGQSGYGGHYYSGYRGGYNGGRGYYGGRGGYGWGYGRGGGYWGRGRGYGWGWGWGFGFGWPYWGWGYPYGYYYNPWYYAPDPYYSHPYQDPNNGDDDPRPADPNARPQPNQNGPARSWGPSTPGDAANANYPNGIVVVVAPRRPVVSVDRIGVTLSSYRAARSIPDRSTMEWSTPQADAALRPEMKKALQRLREMPPFAREREIETGLYRQFSAEEKQILRNAALPSRATIHDLPDSFPQRVSLNSHDR